MLGACSGFGVGERVRTGVGSGFNVFGVGVGDLVVWHGMSAT